MPVDAAPKKDPFGLAGGVLDGRFRIDREVAEGGFGVVYYATQLALDRPVAIKVLKTPAGFDEAAKIQFRDRFASEAKTIARIRHPHIVDVYDFGVSQMPSGEIAPWMALEWLDGQTLEDQLVARRGQGGQSPALVLGVIRPILQAFAFAHKQGIAHRDIKPANIMAVPSEHGMMMRVLDFGIAKLVNPDEAAGTGHTKTSGIPAFSPLYAAPEQIAFGRTGPWTDVHALGLILTELLTDQPPYRAEDMQLFEEIIAQKRPTPGIKGVEVGAWEAVLRKAVSLSPSERWKSAADLLAALEANLGKPAGGIVDVPAGAGASSGNAPATAISAAPASFKATGETAMEIAGMRAAGRPKRGWMVGIGLIVAIGVAIAMFVLHGSPDKRVPTEAPPIAAIPPVPPAPPVAPATLPALPRPVVETAPAPNAVEAPAASAVSPPNDKRAKRRTKPAHDTAVSHPKSDEIEIE
jgi:hypothetical protein